MKNISHMLLKGPLLICRHECTHSGDELRLVGRRDSCR